MAEKDKDLNRITELIEIMKNNGLVELEIKNGDDKIVLKRAQPQPPSIAGVPIVPVASGVAQPQPEAAVPSEADTAAGEQEEELTEIKSPIVGTFYATASPDSDPYVEIGSVVNSQTVVCIIEAMKVMNEIKAEVGGTIAKILVTNGQAVEYGQVLFRVRPD